MTSHFPQFIMFYNTSMQENLADDPLDPDVLDSIFAATEENLPAMLNPRLESAATDYAMLPHRVSSSGNNDREGMRPKQCSDFHQTFEIVEMKHNVPAEIFDPDIVMMKSIVSEIKRNPSLLYQAFDLPWTRADLAKEEPTSSFETELTIPMDKFPRLPFPTDNKRCWKE